MQRLPPPFPRWESLRLSEIDLVFKKPAGFASRFTDKRRAAGYFQCFQGCVDFYSVLFFDTGRVAELQSIFQMMRRRLIHSQRDQRLNGGIFPQIIQHRRFGRMADALHLRRNFKAGSLGRVTSIFPSALSLTDTILAFSFAFVSFLE